MKKWICTSSLFALFLAATAMLVYWLSIPVSVSVWWLSDKSLDVGTFPVFIWLVFNVLAPVMAVAIAVGIAILIWDLAKFCCGKWTTK